VETERDQLYIDGNWSVPSGTDNLEVENPTTQEVMGSIPQGDAQDVDRAVRAAHAALNDWWAVPASERAAMCAKVAEGLQARQGELADLITSELGMPHMLSTLIQTGLPSLTFGSMPDVLSQTEIESEIGNALVVREPRGVVAAITPWNYPLHQIALKLAPALTAGNTVVLKPSEITPLNAFMLFEVLDEVGFPKGVVNLVTGTGPVVGQALAEHPLVDMITFTGSTGTGRRLGEVAARDVKRLALELGGKSANIILDDADLQRAVTDGISKCFLNSGQTCIALTRMLVPENKLDEVNQIAENVASAQKVGDPFEEGVALGPLVSADQRERVRNYIDKGVAEGATLLTGGTEAPAGLDTGYFVQPTVFTNVANDSTIAQEEIFGPVLSIIPFRDEAHAVELANDSPYGLAGAVWSSDDARALDVAKRIRTGQIEVNGGSFNPAAPFGGFKQSGHGREAGVYGLEEFVELKSLQLKG
jgi:aldehyde dehydrogenase (NAD+)